MGDSLSGGRYEKLVGGKKVLVSPHWIERVSWDEEEVFINLSQESIKQSPAYSAEELITRVEVHLSDSCAFCGYNIFLFALGLEPTRPFRPGPSVTDLKGEWML